MGGPRKSLSCHSVLGVFGATRSKLPPSSAEAAFLARWARWSEERRRPAVEEIEGIIRVRAGGACVSLGGRTNSMSRYYASRKV